MRAHVLFICALHGLTVSAFVPHLMPRVSLRGINSKATTSGSGEDDTSSLPLVVPEIVLEESPEQMASRDAQTNSYRTAGIMLAGCALDGLSKTAKVSHKPLLALATSVPTATAFLSMVTIYTLYTASSTNRLNSETYKRLNLSLAAYCFLKLLSFMSHYKAALPMSPSSPTYSIVLCHFYPLLVCINGWFKGALGLGSTEPRSTDKQFLSIAGEELKTGTANTLSIMKSSVSNLYGVGAMAAALMIFHDVIVTVVAKNSVTSMKRFSSAAIATLIFSTLVTLADAEERGRLKGKTFVYLNAAVSCVGATLSFATLSTGKLAPRSLSTLLISGLVSFKAFTKARTFWPKQ